MLASWSWPLRGVIRRVSLYLLFGTTISFAEDDSSWISEAIRLSQQGDLDSAEELFAKSVRKSPPPVNAYANYIVFLRNSKREPTEKLLKVVEEGLQREADPLARKRLTQMHEALSGESSPPKTATELYQELQDLLNDSPKDFCASCVPGDALADAVVKVVSARRHASQTLITKHGSAAVVRALQCCGIRLDDGRHTERSELLFRTILRYFYGINFKTFGVQLDDSPLVSRNSRTLSADGKALDVSVLLDTLSIVQENLQGQVVRKGATDGGTEKVYSRLIQTWEAMNQFGNGADNLKSDRKNAGTEQTVPQQWSEIVARWVRRQEKQRRALRESYEANRLSEITSESDVEVESIVLDDKLRHSSREPAFDGLQDCPRVSSADLTPDKFLRRYVQKSQVVVVSGLKNVTVAWRTFLQHLPSLTASRELSVAIPVGKTGRLNLLVTNDGSTTHATQQELNATYFDFLHHVRLDGDRSANIDRDHRNPIVMVRPYETKMRAEDFFRLMREPDILPPGFFPYLHQTDIGKLLSHHPRLVERGTSAKGSDLESSEQPRCAHSQADLFSFTSLKPSRATGTTSEAEQAVASSTAPALGSLSRLPCLPAFASALQPKLHWRNLWLSPRGVQTDPHFDQYDNILIPIDGSKDLLLFPPTAYRDLEYHPQHQLFPSEGLSASQISTNLANSSYPANFNKAHVESGQRPPFDYMRILGAATRTGSPAAQWIEKYACRAQLGEGDGIFIPAFWTHAVHGLGRSVAQVNFWFERQMEIEDAMDWQRQLRQAGGQATNARGESRRLEL
eukprot:TRINITY_DN67985_c0_g1_i1.p1 TRINITY_DN67985_c0_g1~~TRINITY_DN67985_c0_g1_i1.p1  ORF type:complete len:812 (+),score=90.42 TRINITY_DN67985_c0_g1_i1:50-2437(+)